MRVYGGSTISIKELQPGILDLLHKPLSPNPQRKIQNAGPSARVLRKNPELSIASIGVYFFALIFFLLLLDDGPEKSPIT